MEGIWYQGREFVEIVVCEGNHPNPSFPGGATCFTLLTLGWDLGLSVEIVVC
jgi:hypothetical protein